MPQINDRLGGNGGADPKFKVKGPKAATGKKGRGKHGTKHGAKSGSRKGRTASKGKSTRASVKHAPKAGRWHEAAGAATAAGRTGSIAGEASKETGTMLHPSGKGMAPLSLTADAEKGLGTAAGLGGIILDLVGEGTIKLSGVLAAWARESERITNRTWRRPGGLAKLGGL